MVAKAAIRALSEARHGDPFAVLGWHTRAASSVLRVYWPGAQNIDVVTTDGKLLGVLVADGNSGFFTGTLALRERVDYRLRVQLADGENRTVCDPYSFGPVLSDEQLQGLREGSVLRADQILGAHPICIGGVEGMRFAIWAPNAKRVSVVGEFNQWDGRRHPMRLRHEAGVWELFLPAIGPGQLYKFELLNAGGELLPLKADPYARQAQLRPETASITTAALTSRALPDKRARANSRHAPMSIYEVHASSWCRADDGGFPDWTRLAQRLPAYAKSLGFTHIELMPVSEYPFDGSWGYQSLGLFAPSARFGPPEGFADFVSACHALDVGVIVDWVPAHFPEDAHGMARFDGSALYEYADPREGYHLDWHTLIYNFGRTEVQNFLCASACHWLDRFGIDGLRVDAVASMLYRDYSRPAGQWLPNHLGGRENLEAIALLKRLNERIGAHWPGTMTIAEESTAFPQVSAPTSSGGLGFHFKWNMGWMNDTLRYMHEDPVHRRWHHRLMSFGLVYAYSENYVLPISHDEVVHGKGSMLSKMPGDDWQKFANLRAYYGFMWAHPGKKLLFMGQEFAQREEWNHAQPLPWELLEQPAHKGVQRLIQDLNALYQGQVALHYLDCLPQGFQWLIEDDEENSVFAWARFGPNGESVVVVCNFTPVPRLQYRIGVPAGKRAWRELLNTDADCYGGSNLGNGSQALEVFVQAAHGQNQSIVLTLPPLACVFLGPA